MSEVRRLYLAVDGGGSKLIAVLYDDGLTEICRARSGGVNPTQNPLPSVKEHIADCVSQLAPHLGIIECADEVIAGRRELFEEELAAKTEVRRFRPIGEPQAGLFAGACRLNGLVAISGTGSDVFLIQNGKVVCTVGGWGPVMGDQGSGAWIGLQALRALGRAANGWGKKTILTDILEAHFLQTTGLCALRAVLASPAPYRVAADVVPFVAQAAREGDEVALEIFERAGEAIARQLEALIQRAPEHTEREIVLCGGAWKAHERMLDACREYLRRAAPEYIIKRPCFEHVLAGPALRLLESGMTVKETRITLAHKFPDFIIDEGESVS